MTPSFEQVVEMAQNLPSADFDKFIRWANSQQPRNGKQDETKREKFAEGVRKFRLSMDWIRANRQEYLGQWVCLDGDKLISHGFDAKKAFREAEEAGYKSAFCERIVEEPQAYMGGFEACP
jgi:hypothetical protein